MSNTQQPPVPSPFNPFGMPTPKVADDATREKVKEQIRRAKTFLILNHPFFGTIALQMPLKEEDSCPTFATNGKTIVYNPSYAATLTYEQLISAICHEILHIAAGHPWRRGDREPQRYNLAGDHAINHLITASKLPLGQGWACAEQFKGLSSEEIYPLIKVVKIPMGQGGMGQGGGCVCENKAPTSAQDQADAEVLVSQAAKTAKMQGHLPAGLEQLVQDLLRPRVDWRQVLRRFVQQVQKNDYTYRRPNTRHLPAGLYMPALRSEEVGEIAVWIDTSGSTGDIQQQFLSEVASILDEVKPAHTLLGYCDATVYEEHIHHFEAGETITAEAMTLPGQGGTSFKPPFDYMEREAIQPACMIYLTDLEGDFPEVPPPFPVLWITDNNHVAPFGETVRMETEIL